MVQGWETGFGRIASKRAQRVGSAIDKVLIDWLGRGKTDIKVHALQYQEDFVDFAMLGNGMNGFMRRAGVGYPLFLFSSLGRCHGSCKDGYDLLRQYLTFFS